MVLLTLQQITVWRGCRLVWFELAVMCLLLGAVGFSCGGSVILTKRTKKVGCEGFVLLVNTIASNKYFKELLSPKDRKYHRKNQTNLLTI